MPPERLIRLAQRRVGRRLRPTAQTLAGSASASHRLNAATWVRFQAGQPDQRDQRRVSNKILALLEGLAANTIDRQLKNPTRQVGLEISARLRPPAAPAELTFLTRAGLNPATRQGLDLEERFELMLVT